MRAKELRIGNLVYSPLNKINFKINQANLCDFANGFFYLEPTRITDEWLLNLGAKKFNHAFLYDRFRLIPRPEYGFYQVVDKETNVYITKVEFVHEWQNVVFVLNGQELTLKTES